MEMTPEVLDWMRGPSRLVGWRAYYRAVEENPPSPLAQKTLSLVQGKTLGIDLGCGTCTDANFFLEHGFDKFIGVDASKDSASYARGIISRHNGRFEFHNTAFEDLDLGTGVFDLIHSNLSLYCLGREGLMQMIERIRKALKQDGLLSMSLKGYQDRTVLKYPEFPVFMEWEIREMLFGMKVEILPVILNKQDGTRHILQVHASNMKL